MDEPVELAGRSRTNCRFLVFAIALFSAVTLVLVAIFLTRDAAPTGPSSEGNDSCGDNWVTWDDTVIPDGSPFPLSKMGLLQFSLDCFATYGNQDNHAPAGTHKAISADTWLFAWANDGNLYTPWADGIVLGNDGTTSHCYGGQLDNHSVATIGQAKISGEDPMNLTLSAVQCFNMSATPYQGRYPSGGFFWNGTWYDGTYSIDNPNGPSCANWCTLRPFVGFRISSDYGHSWIDEFAHMTGPMDNIFQQDGSDTHPIRFGVTHVVDFGQELRESPTGHAYIISHGALGTVAVAGNENWSLGSAWYMARARPGPNLNSLSEWEFYSPVEGWRKGGVEMADPIATWVSHLGASSITYVPALAKYLMIGGVPTRAPWMNGTFDWMVLEADFLTGPYRLIQYLREFGPQAYFPHIPSKFLSPRIYINAAGTRSYEFWVTYSANWIKQYQRQDGSPTGSGYRMCLRKFRILLER